MNQTGVSMAETDVKDSLILEAVDSITESEVDNKTHLGISQATDDAILQNGRHLLSAESSLANNTINSQSMELTMISQPQTTMAASGEQVTLVADPGSVQNSQQRVAVLSSQPGVESIAQQNNIITVNADQLHGGSGDNLSDNTTLQSLLQANAANNGETIQIITVNNSSELQTGKIWQVLPCADNSGIATIIAVNQPTQESHNYVMSSDGKPQQEGNPNVVELVHVDNVASLLMPPPQPPPQNLPPGCPSWAARLKDCEKIGDAFRGWVESEVELDLLLTYHKQQTSSFWGTRQSPSPAKQSTRLMWKSQYVPFDGLPFVNSGSRAIVMECQYGPRRKGGPQKKPEGGGMGKGDFKQTCPARIYIKKVKKYPEYAVDIHLDKKTLKLHMDKSFQRLKELGASNAINMGQDRFYVQLPTEKAHEFHNESVTQAESEPMMVNEAPTRLHPRVAQKVRDLVANGETRLYAIRKNLRKFVEKELFESADAVPEKHNLSYYPTVNDLHNHIYQALKDIETGVLPVTAQTVNVEVITSGEAAADGGELAQRLWQNGSRNKPHAETVTVTLTQNPDDDGHHIISRVETHLSDGSTEVSSSLTEETAQLLSKLHPNMFPAGSIVQLQDLSATIQANQGVNFANNAAIVQEVEAQKVAMSQEMEVQHAAMNVNPNPTDILSAAATLENVSAQDVNEHDIVSAHNQNETILVKQEKDGSYQIMNAADGLSVDGNEMHIIQTDDNLQAVEEGSIHIVHGENASLHIGDATEETPLTIVQESDGMTVDSVHTDNLQNVEQLTVGDQEENYIAVTLAEDTPEHIQKHYEDGNRQDTMEDTDSPHKQ